VRVEGGGGGEGSLGCTLGPTTGKCSSWQSTNKSRFSHRG